MQIESCCMHIDRAEKDGLSSISTSFVLLAYSARRMPCNRQCTRRGRTIAVDKWRRQRGGKLATRRRDYFYRISILFPMSPRVLCGRYFSILSYKFDPDSSVPCRPGQLDFHYVRDCFRKIGCSGTSRYGPRHRPRFPLVSCASAVPFFAILATP